MAPLTAAEIGVLRCGPSLAFPTEVLFLDVLGSVPSGKPCFIYWELELPIVLPTSRRALLWLSTLDEEHVFHPLSPASAGCRLFFFHSPSVAFRGSSRMMRANKEMTARPLRLLFA